VNKRATLAPSTTFHSYWNSR